MMMTTTVAIVICSWGELLGCVKGSKGSRVGFFLILIFTAHLLQLLHLSHLLGADPVATTLTLPGWELRQLQSPWEHLSG